MHKDLHSFQNMNVNLKKKIRKCANSLSIKGVCEKIYAKILCKKLGNVKSEFFLMNVHCLHHEQMLRCEIAYRFQADC